MLNRTAAITPVRTPAPPGRPHHSRPHGTLTANTTVQCTRPTEYTRSPRTPGSRAARSFPAAARQCLLLVLLENLGRALRNHTQPSGPRDPPARLARQTPTSIVYTCRVNSLIRTLPLPPALLPRLGPAAAPARGGQRGAPAGPRCSLRPLVRARGVLRPFAGVVRSGI